MKLFVGASSNGNISNDVLSDCTNLLEEILKENDLVFGASNNGLMGLSYQIAKKNHRLVTGICPEVYKASLSSIECDKEEVTTSIIDSTNRIFESSDVILMLPGGFGTIFEFFTANYCKICNELNKPIILYNSCGYFDELLSFINNLEEKEIIKEKETGAYFVANSKEDVINYLNHVNKD